MTEQEWVACADPMKVLEFLGGKASERKGRLFACACCRSIWDFLNDERSRSAVRVAEAAADGQASAREQVEAYTAAEATVRERRDDHPELGRVRAPTSEWRKSAPTAVALAAEHPWDVRSAGLVAKYAVDAVARPSYAESTWVVTQQAERQVQCQFLRDIFSNPFRPVSLPPAWMTSAVPKLAQAAYENRLLPAGLLDNTRLAVLVDALEEAGCDNQDLLSHLRGPGPHVRGCWPVDLVLGRG